MKKIVVVVLLCMLPSFAYAQPSIAVDKQTHDFGTVHPAESLAYDFEFANNGTEDLLIEKLVPS